MASKKVRGLLAAAGISINAGIALPLVNVLTMFTPEQLLAVRGFLAASLFCLLLRGRVFTRDRYTFGIMFWVALAALGLFRGIREWGAIPTMIMLAASPLVNFVITLIRRKPLSKAAIVGLTMILSGTIIAFWRGSYGTTGVWWALLATGCQGVLYEYFAKATSSPYQRCFWGSLGIGTIGLALSWHSDWPSLTANPNLTATLIGFALIGGAIYWYANVKAFELLPKDEASVLAQLETPAVIGMSMLLLHERLRALQAVGVLVVLVGAVYLSRHVSKENTE